MNSDTAIDFLKKGFRVTLGATASLVESIQDPLKREENLAQIQLSPSEFTERLAEKGAVAEVEARRLVDSVVTQYSGASTSPSTPAPSVTTVVDSALERELRELTAQLKVLRLQIVQGDSSDAI